MQTIFSPRFKYTTWRRLWIALAKGEKKLGLPIPTEAIKRMEAKIEEIDFDLVAKYERELRHDVMAHLYTFLEKCPEAKGALHLGATSAFITDNTDIIQIQGSLKLLMAKLIELIRLLKKNAEKYASLPTVSYTHFQPAQPTTVGKRMCLWLQDFLFDLQDLIEKEEGLYFLGIKGATGTQASFMTLFNQDGSKVEKLDHLLASDLGFKKVFPISGQTYTRKQDMRVFSVLEGLGASSHKCGTDLRLLAHLGELAESFGEKQVGSSAMPHKQNPIYAERLCGIARFLLSLSTNGGYTLATQWLERSLDDSSNRRLVIPEIFLSADALLNLLIHIFEHIKVNSKKTEKNLSEHLPLLSLENILLCAVKKGKDREEVHEKLRTYTHQGNDFIKKIEKDKSIGLSKEEIHACLKPDIGRAPAQVKDFLKNQVDPLLQKYKDLKAPLYKVNV